MSKIFSNIALVLWHLKFSLGLQTYYMSDYCGGEIDMVIQDIYAGQLSIDGTFKGDCNVTIETWYSADRLMFYFQDFNLPYTSTLCEDNYLQVFDKNSMGDFQLMHGLHMLCGSHIPTKVYVPRGRYVLFRYVSNGTVTNNMDLVFTAFHTGNCHSYEYRCSNDRCIDDRVNCNGFNPCGDHSDCELSTAAVAGIVIGSVFAICVVGTLVFVFIRNKNGKTAIRTVQNTTSSSTTLINPPAAFGTSVKEYESLSGYTQVVPPVSGYQIQNN